MSRENLNRLRKRKVRIRGISRLILLSLFIILSITGIIVIPKSINKGIKNSGEISNNANETKNIEEPKEYTLKLSAVGDILIHSTIYKVSKTNETYDFRYIFEPIKQYISESDITIANLEVPVAGEKFKYSSYPMFNCPGQILDALKFAGFNTVTTANNHALDKGEKGLLSSIDNISKAGFGFTGTAKSIDDIKPIIIEKNNIKIGLF